MNIMNIKLLSNIFLEGKKKKKNPMIARNEIPSNPPYSTTLRYITLFNSVTQVQMP